MEKVIILSVGFILIFGCGGSPDDTFYEIDISKPREGENFTLPAQINVQATNIPEERNSGPEWYMVENTLAWDYTWYPSLESTFSDGILSKYSLYSTNNQFGDHTVAIRFVDKDNNEKVSGVTVQIFFNRDDWGMGSSPNWYYYWNQTGASSGSHLYDDTFSGYGYYNYGDSYFYIGSQAYDVNSVTGSNGIDTFAETCLHENKHKTNYEIWWAPLGGYNPAYDLDGDYALDSAEPALGFDPTVPDTDNDGVDDEEETAYDAMGNWSVGSADSEDWADPGHQSSM